MKPFMILAAAKILKSPTQARTRELPPEQRRKSKRYVAAHALQRPHQGQRGHHKRRQLIMGIPELVARAFRLLRDRTL
jgi:hypothetical protein